MVWAKIVRPGSVKGKRLYSSEPAHGIQQQLVPIGWVVYTTSKEKHPKFPYLFGWIIFKENIPQMWPDILQSINYHVYPGGFQGVGGIQAWKVRPFVWNTRSDQIFAALSPALIITEQHLNKILESTTNYISLLQELMDPWWKMQQLHQQSLAHGYS